jgi:hypothetical protein
MFLPLFKMSWYNITKFLSELFRNQSSGIRFYYELSFWQNLRINKTSQTLTFLIDSQNHYSNDFI